MVADLESELTKVWSGNVRPLVDEAWRCYNAGAVRAAIAATWTAVTADVIEKITWLADGDDADAEAVRAEVETARSHGINPEGVRAMQKIEDMLLDHAQRFELIDSIGQRELNRIREDRNLCVHPTLRHLGEAYDPRPEVARGHLATALSTVLVHPPTQGRKVLAEFTASMSEALFVPSTAHIQATFFDRVRTATRRNVVEVAAKHALCELPVPPDVPIPAHVVADRMAEALKAFALRNRELVRDTLAGLESRFRPLEGGAQLRALTRLGDQDFFWEVIDQPLSDRLDGLVRGVEVPVGEWELLPAELSSLLALLGDEQARGQLPSLEERFNTLTYMHQLSVAAARPSRYFVPKVISHVEMAGGYRTAEQVGQLLVVPYGPLFTMEDLRAVLEKWSHNSQCRAAMRMPGLAGELVAATRHLGSERHAVWDSFLVDVRAVAEDSYYRYDEVEAALESERIT